MVKSEQWEAISWIALFSAISEAAEIGGTRGEEENWKTVAPKQEAEIEIRIGPVESLVLTVEWTASRGGEELPAEGKLM